MTSHRGSRIADAIKQHISMIIQGEMVDPRVSGVTVERVDLATDGSHAKVFFTTAENHEEVLAVLNRAVSFVRTRLAQGLNLRHTPSIKFVFDQESAQAYRVAEKIEQFKRDRDDI